MVTQLLSMSWVRWRTISCQVMEVSNFKKDPTIGLTVAVWYSDMTWHRGKVVWVKKEVGMVEIEYLV